MTEIPSLIILTLSSLSQRMHSEHRPDFRLHLSNLLHDKQEEIYRHIFANLDQMDYCVFCDSWTSPLNLSSYHAIVYHESLIPSKSNWCTCASCSTTKWTHNLPKYICCVNCSQPYHRAHLDSESGFSCDTDPQPCDRGSPIILRSGSYSGYNGNNFVLTTKASPKISEWVQRLAYDLPLNRFIRGGHALCDNCVNVMLLRGELAHKL
jgi:hypothetical protein